VHHRLTRRPAVATRQARQARLRLAVLKHARSVYSTLSSNLLYSCCGLVVDWLYNKLYTTTCDRPLRRCVDLSRRQHLRNALFDALHRETVLSSESVAVFKSRLKTFLFSQAFSSSSAHEHAVWPQRLWSHDLMALYKSVYLLLLL